MNIVPSGDTSSLSSYPNLVSPTTLDRHIAQRGPNRHLRPPHTRTVGQGIRRAFYYLTLVLACSKLSGAQSMLVIDLISIP